MNPLPGSKSCLFAVAAPKEAQAVLVALGADPALASAPWRLHPTPAGVDVVVTGVGKACAAGALGRFASPEKHRLVVSLGIAGACPGSGLNLGEVVVGSASSFSDEGLLSPAGFQTIADMGFPPVPGVAGAAVAAAEFAGTWPALLGARLGPIATVSTCSGTDALAKEVVSRTGAIAEAMEGAAVGVVASRLGIPFAEVRVISNTTGDRSGQKWDLAGALTQLGEVARVLANHLNRG